MVQTCKRITQRKSYGESKLPSEMEMVSSGDVSKRQVMKQFGIPRSTLAKRMQQPDFHAVNLGRVFNDEFERELVEYAAEMQNRFYGFAISDLRSLAYRLE